MMDEDSQISGFDRDVGEIAPLAVDFATAKRLDAGGSTCEVYECLVQRRRVFVKRLKAEFRDNPLYRSAFNKEYDLGVSLTHPSLPRYVGFGGDYIMLDFIEGDTLANLIRRADSRLKNKRFVRKLLLDLIDAVEYLHHRNIVHCDIKADNIIVPPYTDRPAVLIDFDKAYSPWLDSTHGDAARYGCEGCADGAIDYKGIGLIAEKLGLRRVAEACCRDNVNAESLRKMLRGRNYLWVAFAGVVIALAVVAALLWTREDVQIIDAEAPAIIADTLPEAASPQPVPPQKPPIDPAVIESLIAEKSAEIDKYRRTLWQTLDCDTVSIADKQTAIMDYHFQADLATTRIIYSAVQRYRHLPEHEVQSAVRSHPAWIRLTNAEAEMDQRLSARGAK